MQLFALLPLHSAGDIISALTGDDPRPAAQHVPPCRVLLVAPLPLPYEKVYCLEMSVTVADYWPVTPWD